LTGITRTALAVLALTILAAGSGGWLGVHYGLAASRSPTSLNRLLHHELHLTADQKRQLAALETRYDARRKMLEAQARQANRELAAALLASHEYTPQDEQAIEHLHVAMKALQIATVKHLLGMRAVLTPTQAAKFDKTVAAALDSGRR